jgi:hypothetical protein
VAQQLALRAPLAPQPEAGLGGEQGCRIPSGPGTQRCRGPRSIETLERPGGGTRSYRPGTGEGGESVWEVALCSTMLTTSTTRNMLIYDGLFVTILENVINLHDL